MSDSLSSGHDRDELIDQFTRECREGQNPRIEDYIQRYPEQDPEQLRDLLSAILLMENLGQQEHVALGKMQRQARFQFLRQTIEEIGDYQIIREIGRGGMGLVYEAQQKSLNRRVAIKVLPSLELDGEGTAALQRFRRESQAAAGLHHTHIVPIFDVGEQDGLCFYVMQFIDGCGLDLVIKTLLESEPEQAQRFDIVDVVDDARRQTGHGQAGVSSRSNTRMPTLKDGRVASPPELPNPELSVEQTVRNGYWDFVVQLGIQVANAIEYAHGQGVIHRDIKPSNLLVDRQGKIWIADFGLAKLEQQQELTQTGDVLGTLQYMAPEQLKGESDQRSDLFGIGATLFELLCLQPLVTQAPLDEMIRKISGPRSASELRKINPKIPKDLETIVLKLIESDPTKRYFSAAELEKDLRRFLERKPISARRTSTLERGWRWCRRNQTVAALSSMVLALLCVVASVMTVGYFNEASLRERTEQTLETSLAALDQVYRKLAPDRTVLFEPAAQGEEQASVQPVLSREAAEVLVELLPAYDRLAGQARNSVKHQRDAAAATARAAEIRYRIGDWASAIETFETAIGKYEGLAEKGHRFDLELAKLHNQLGATQLVHGIEGHQLEFQKAADLLTAYETEPISDRNASEKLELARSLYLLSRRSRPRIGLMVKPTGQGRLPSLGDEERRQLARAIEIVEQLIEFDPGFPEFDFLLGLCLRERRSDADLEEAKNLLRGLAQSHGDVADYVCSYAETIGLVDIYGSEASSPQAMGRELVRAIEMVERLNLLHAGVPRFVHLLAVLKHRRCITIMWEGDFIGDLPPEKLERALALAQDAVELQAACIDLAPEIETHIVGLAQMHQTLSDIYLETGDVVSALLEIDQAIEKVQGSIGHRDPQIAAAANRSMQIYLRQSARCQRFLGNEDEAALEEFFSSTFIDE